MNMSGQSGLLSVPVEHMPGLWALVAVPLAFLCAALVVHIGVAHGWSWAVALNNRLSRVGTTGKAALFFMVLGASVHICLVPTHWADDRVLAILFCADTLGFAGASALVLTNQRWWRPASLAMLAGTVAGYIFYLVRGWETADLVGVLTTGTELVGVVVLAAPTSVRLEIRRARWSIAAAVPVATATMALSVFATSTAQADTTSTSGAAASVKLSLPTTSPAGPITWPMSMPGMEGGMKMSTPDCMTSPSRSQQQAAVNFVNSTIPALEQFRSLAAARAAGYFPITPSGLPVVHYVNVVDVVKAPSDPLDPKAIQSLVYANTSHGGVLVGAMYTMGMNQVGQAPPMPGGCLTEWHLHTNLCFSDTSQVVDGLTVNGICQAGSSNRVTQPMIHVWYAPVPGGPLAVDASGDQIVAAANQLPILDPPNPTA